MLLKDRIVVVTGAASGIGRALARRFYQERAKLVVCADLDGEGAKRVADEIGGVALTIDVGKEADIEALVANVERDYGGIDLFCSNAGIIGAYAGVEAPNEVWQRVWDVNVMAHIWAARHVVPRMIARGGGYLLNTASAAGLLSQVDTAPYTVTKHAAVALAEWLAIAYGEKGIKVSVLCPQAVRTAMATGRGGSVASVDGMVEPEDAAEACVRAIESETFLVLTHPQVLEYMRRKTSDYERWLGGMRKLARRFSSARSYDPTSPSL